MIRMLLSLFVTCWSMLTRMFTSLIRFMLFLVLFYSFCSYMGWIRRFLWFWIETQLSEIWNGAEVTIGSLEVNLVQGKLIAHNAVVHTPHRKEWKWESPLIARVGKVYVEWNMFSIAYQMIYELKDPPIVDLYSLHLSDIQVFAERQQHIFNVYLLDPAIVLPDPSEIVKEEVRRSSVTANGGTTASDASIAVEQDEDDTEQQAQEIVNQLFIAVKQIGRKGGWKGAWRAQKQSLTQKLRQLQSTNKKTEYMQESVKVITKVGKVVAKTTNTYIDKNPLVPQYRELENPLPTVYCRVGRVLLHNVRVFTRQDGKWNKPIVLKEITIRPAELCPPMSSVDEQGHAALYQPIEKLVEVAWKRVLTEMAKSQTGRLLNTAMGEVLGMAMTTMQDPEWHSSTTTTVAASATSNTTVASVAAATTTTVAVDQRNSHRSTAPPTILEYRPKSLK